MLVILKSTEQIERDVYYDYLAMKYNEYDCDELIDIISEEENHIREYLELRVD